MLLRTLVQEECDDQVLVVWNIELNPFSGSPPPPTASGGRLAIRRWFRFFNLFTTLTQPLPPPPLHYWGVTLLLTSYIFKNRFVSNDFWPFLCYKRVNYSFRCSSLTENPYKINYGDFYTIVWLHIFLK